MRKIIYFYPSFSDNEQKTFRLRWRNNRSGCQNCILRHHVNILKTNCSPSEKIRFSNSISDIERKISQFLPKISSRLSKLHSTCLFFGNWASNFWSVSGPFCRVVITDFHVAVGKYFWKKLFSENVVTLNQLLTLSKELCAFYRFFFGRFFHTKFYVTI